MIQEGASASPYFLQPFHALDGMVSAAGDGEPGTATAASDMHCHALLYNLSVLKDKVQQLHPLVGLAVAHDGPDPVAVSSAGAVIQEIIGAASSMMYAFQQLCLGPTTATTHDMGVSVHCSHAENDTVASGDQVIMNHVLQQLQHHGGYNRNDSNTAAVSAQETDQAVPADMIIELDAAELLAKYTHYCQVCGKGFKRDANLRMHMRAHGDEYKTNAALANPARPIGEDRTATDVPALAAAERKYSCPQEGCRWNRKHARFQPLKSVVCVKNHYRRSHCPKMYVCNRCSRKQFSVLSDLRTHEKHCGDHRWLCSCGTSFSRKDKLLGHVALFAGHAPNVPLESLVGARHGKRSAHPGNGNAIASDIGMGTT